MECVHEWLRDDHQQAEHTGATAKSPSSICLGSSEKDCSYGSEHHRLVPACRHQFLGVGHGNAATTLIKTDATNRAQVG